MEILYREKEHNIIRSDQNYDLNTVSEIKHLNKRYFNCYSILYVLSSVDLIIILCLSYVIFIIIGNNFIFMFWSSDPITSRRT